MQAAENVGCPLLLAQAVELMIGIAGTVVGVYYSWNAVLADPFSDFVAYNISCRGRDWVHSAYFKMVSWRMRIYRDPYVNLARGPLKSVLMVLNGQACLGLSFSRAWV